MEWPHWRSQCCSADARLLLHTIHTLWPLLPFRLQLQDAAVKAREDAASFDTSRLVEYSERVVWEGPALQLSPLVREPGRLAVTTQRVYFQPLQNIAGVRGAG